MRCRIPFAAQFFLWDFPFESFSFLWHQFSWKISLWDFMFCSYTTILHEISCFYGCCTISAWVFMLLKSYEISKDSLLMRCLNEICRRFPWRLLSQMQKSCYAHNLLSHSITIRLSDLCALSDPSDLSDPVRPLRPLRPLRPVRPLRLSPVLSDLSDLSTCPTSPTSPTIPSSPTPPPSPTRPTCSTFLTVWPVQLVPVRISYEISLWNFLLSVTPVFL